MLFRWGDYKMKMKKHLITALLSAMLLLMTCVAAYAADAVGLYGLSEGLTAKKADGTVVTEATTVGSKKVYMNAEQVEFTYSAAKEGAEYLVLVQAEDSEDISYIDQVTATGDSVTFHIYPTGLEKNKKYIIRLVSDDDTNLIRLTEQGSFYCYRPGLTVSGKILNGVEDVRIRLYDPNQYRVGKELVDITASGDYSFTVTTAGKYILYLTKEGYVTRKLSVTINDDRTYNIEICALGDVNKDGSVDALDMQCLYEYLAGTGTLNVSNAYIYTLADVNKDKTIDIYDLQRLYEAVSLGLTLS